MIARPTDITHTGPITPDLASAESPMQRQILLWQRELLRRADAEKRRNGEATQPTQLRETNHQPEG